MQVAVGRTGQVIEQQGTVVVHDSMGRGQLA